MSILPNTAPALSSPSSLWKPRLLALRRRLPTLLVLLRLIAIILCATFTMLLLLYFMLGLAPYLANASTYWGYTCHSCFDIDKSHWPTWTQTVPDDFNVSSLSVPGTHDTMSYTIRSRRLRCQNWDLRTQLQAGIRYLDIRARLRDDRLHIYHADTPTGHSYVDVLVTVFDYLQDHPGEFIVMRLKEEGEPLGRNTMPFHGAFSNVRFTDPRIKDRWHAHWYVHNDSMPLPTVGQIRNKIFILQGFPSPEFQYGLRWDGPQMVLQDEWVLQDMNHIEEKMDAIVNHFEKANSAPLDNQHLYLSHLSASVGVLPIEAAAGTQNRSIEGLNDRTNQYIRQQFYEKGASRLGVVIIDFPGDSLVNIVLRRTGHAFHQV
ncbi:1-phosphatidylinositol phosphodiesterase precursor [Metarhizium album ARSEF 1941]|uniref:1-phosphatidylinositol phosphodiesterase n=1 Tax=Metarhizium album (strain ARSEF 1941) TaxID=1081103 RepID=A0A0B2X976_METAS|nr:1-phosphatidylinositol phosphodiesterase precursor [Metarhizium album ARSEF 1941]KHO02125.1 1-phosphatidylinositol phosphodiesterase precursor [Metarhizium album ARSEF 1941]